MPTSSTSSKAWRRALPDSSWSRSSSSSRRSKTRSWKASRIRRRSAKDVSRHCSCAARARWTASSTSSAVQRGTVPRSSPVAGRSISIVSRSPSPVVTRPASAWTWEISIRREPVGAARREVVALAAMGRPHAEADVEEVEHHREVAPGVKPRTLERQLVAREQPRKHALAEQQHERDAGAVLAPAAEVVEARVALALEPALGAQAVGVGHGLGVAVVEGVEDHHLGALVELGAGERGLARRLAREQRRRRPQPHRLLQAALEVAQAGDGARVPEVGALELVADA